MKRNFSSDEDRKILFGALTGLIVNSDLTSILEEFKKFIEENQALASRYICFGPSTPEQKKIFYLTSAKVRTIVDNLELFIDILKKQQKHE